MVSGSDSPGGEWYNSPKKKLGFLDFSGMFLGGVGGIFGRLFGRFLGRVGMHSDIFGEATRTYVYHTYNKLVQQPMTHYYNLSVRS